MDYNKTNIIDIDIPNNIQLIKGDYKLVKLYNLNDILNINELRLF
jgi:hypothetical protein